MSSSASSAPSISTTVSTPKSRDDPWSLNSSYFQIGLAIAATLLIIVVIIGVFVYIKYRRNSRIQKDLLATEAHRQTQRREPRPQRTQRIPPVKVPIYEGKFPRTETETEFSEKPAAPQGPTYEIPVPVASRAADVKTLHFMSHDDDIETDSERGTELSPSVKKKSIIAAKPGFFASKKAHRNSQMELLGQEDFSESLIINPLHTPKRNPTAFDRSAANMVVGSSQSDPKYATLFMKKHTVRIALRPSDRSDDDKAAELKLSRSIQRLRADQLDITQTIGEGRFGPIYRAAFRSKSSTTVQFAAAKSFVKSRELSPTEQETFLREAERLSTLSHPNIVQCLGVLDDAHHICIVLEYVSEQTLREFLAKQSSLTAKLVRIATEVACGVAYLGSSKVVHGELTCRNILIKYSGGVKISGFSSSFPSPAVLRWRAIEAWESDDYLSSASDVWSLGICLYEIFNGGAVPFDGQSNTTIKRMLDAGNRLPPGPSCPSMVYSLMVRCWHPCPWLRITGEALFGHLLDLSHSTRTVAISPSVNALQSIYIGCRVPLLSEVDAWLANGEMPLHEHTLSHAELMATLPKAAACPDFDPDFSAARPLSISHDSNETPETNSAFMQTSHHSHGSVESIGMESLSSLERGEHSNRTVHSGHSTQTAFDPPPTPSDKTGFRKAFQHTFTAPPRKQVLTLNAS